MAGKPPYAGFVKNEFNDPLLRMVGGWYNKEYYDRFKVIHFAFKVLPEGATIHGNKAIPNRKLTNDTSSNNVNGDPSIANDKDFINDLDAMMKAAGANTYSSGYRTLSYINGTNSGGKSKDRAPAGGSEHQTGYCVDTPNTKITTAQFNAINAVAHKYGFVQTFTKANSSKTNVVVENWHWKWVGNAKARSLLTPIDGSLAGMLALSYGGVDAAIEHSKKVKTRDTGTLYEALKNDFEALKAGKTVTGVGGTTDGETTATSGSSDTTNGGGGSGV